MSTLAKKKNTYYLTIYATTVNVLKFEMFIYYMINVVTQFMYICITYSYFILKLCLNIIAYCNHRQLRIRIVAPVDRKQIRLPDINTRYL